MRECVSECYSDDDDEAWFVCVWCVWFVCVLVC